MDSSSGRCTKTTRSWPDGGLGPTRFFRRRRHRRRTQRSGHRGLPGPRRAPGLCPGAARHRRRRLRHRGDSARVSRLHRGVHRHQDAAGGHPRAVSLEVRPEDDPVRSAPVRAEPHRTAALHVPGCAPHRGRDRDDLTPRRPRLHRVRRRDQEAGGPPRAVLPRASPGAQRRPRLAQGPGASGPADAETERRGCRAPDALPDRQRRGPPRRALRNGRGEEPHRLLQRPRRSQMAEDPTPAQKSDFTVCHGLAYHERAWDEAKHGRASTQPYVDCVVPTHIDPTLAPPGRAVLTAFVQYAPYHLKEGSWATERERLADRVTDAIEEVAPNFKRSVMARDILSPVDLESRFALTEGNIFHGDLSLGQLFLGRPVPGWARYRTPVRGLYLCGAGVHPGGGVTGAPGYNAAQQILRDWKTKQLR